MTQTDMHTLSTHMENRKHFCTRPTMHRRNRLWMHDHTISTVVWHLSMQSCLLLYAQVQLIFKLHACMPAKANTYADEDTYVLKIIHALSSFSCSRHLLLICIFPDGKKYFCQMVSCAHAATFTFWRSFPPLLLVLLLLAKYFQFLWNFTSPHNPF